MINNRRTFLDRFIYQHHYGQIQRCKKVRFINGHVWGNRISNYRLMSVKEETVIRKIYLYRNQGKQYPLGKSETVVIYNNDYIYFNRCDVNCSITNHDDIMNIMSNGDILYNTELRPYPHKINKEKVTTDDKIRAILLKRLIKNGLTKNYNRDNDNDNDNGINK